MAQYKFQTPRGITPINFEHISLTLPEQRSQLALEAAIYFLPHSSENPANFLLKQRKIKPVQLITKVKVTLFPQFSGSQN